MNFVLKNGEKWSFSYEMKASIHLAKQVEWIYGVQSLKEWRLWCESMFILAEGWTLLIQKLVEREVFLMKPKHEYHLSQWEECVYGAQSWTEWRLLRECMTIPIDKWSLIL